DGERRRCGGAGGGLCRGGAGGQPLAPGAGASRRSAGARVHLHAAALRGTGMTGRSRQLAHRVTTRHLGAAYPFMASGALGADGVLLGRDLFGGPFAYDPWELYARGLISNPNMLVIGEVGTGKSALKKSYLLRQIAFGRRAVSINAKREDDRLCQAVGVEPIRLERGGPVRLNPLDARIAGPGADGREGQVSQLRLLRAIIGAALRRDLTPEEQRACKQALLA